MDINSYEAVPEPESVPPEEEEVDELFLSRMMSAASKGSSEASEVMQVYKKSGRSDGDLAEFAPERAIIKAMCSVALKSLD